MKQASPESLSQHSVVTCVRDRVWRRGSQGAVTHHGPVLTLPFFKLCAFTLLFTGVVESSSLCVVLLLWPQASILESFKRKLVCALTE